MSNTPEIHFEGVLDALRGALAELQAATEQEGICMNDRYGPFWQDAWTLLSDALSLLQIRAPLARPYIIVPTLLLPGPFLPDLPSYALQDTTLSHPPGLTDYGQGSSFHNWSDGGGDKSDPSSETVLSLPPTGSESTERLQESFQGAFDYLEITFEPAKTTYPRSPGTLHHTPFSPKKNTDSEATAQLKAKLDGKDDSVAERRRRFQETRTLKARKSFLDVPARVEEVQRQMELDNLSLLQSSVERQNKAMRRREHVLDAIQQAARNTLSRVPAAFERRTQKIFQKTEQQQKELKKQYALVEQRREAFNQQIIRKALETRLGNRKATSEENGHRYIDSVWPCSIYYEDPAHGLYVKKKHCIIKGSQPEKLPIQSSLKYANKTYETITPPFLELCGLALRAISNVIEFYSTYTMYTKEYICRLLPQVKGLIHDITKRGVEPGNVLEMLRNCLSRCMSIGDAGRQNESHSAAVAVFRIKASELHIATFCLCLSYASLSGNYLYRILPALQAIILGLESDKYAVAERALARDLAVLTTFLCSMMLRFGVLFISQTIDDPLIVEQSVSNYVKVTDLTHYLTRNSGILFEALILSILNCGVRILTLVNDRETAISCFNDAFILKGCISRIMTVVVPADIFIDEVSEKGNACLHGVHLYDAYAATQQALILLSLVLYEDYVQDVYAGDIFKGCSNCIAQILLSSNSFRTHTTCKHKFQRRSITRIPSDPLLNSAAVRASAIDFILAADLHTLVAAAFLTLLRGVKRFWKIFIEILAIDEVFHLELYHSLTVLPLPGVLFADEPSLYCGFSIPHCLAFPRYLSASDVRSVRQQENCFGQMHAFYCKSLSPVITLSVLRFEASIPTSIFADTFPFTPCFECYPTIPAGLLSGLLLVRYIVINANEDQNMLPIELLTASIGDDPMTARLLVNFLPVECFIDEFLRNTVIAPIFDTIFGAENQQTDEVSIPFAQDTLTTAEPPRTSFLFADLILT
ncbi:hypothetical protein GMRT_13578 [Giardia muris]|uniref:Uncharacterized protein n=1 Tax=Giardia muris TaxID=5742 RepID=A0A4Z1T2W8_GIAMU|nr:hypothetical protein GMRT_13578 [Giardia muris]|eukprot:TNJ29998.1 hypothetical protein GMRT_13578 [Giardia muris]